MPCPALRRDGPAVVPGRAPTRAATAKLARYAASSAARSGWLAVATASGLLVPTVGGRAGRAVSWWEALGRG